MSVPVPVLVSAPVPPMLPSRVRVVPEAVSNVPPPPFRVTAWKAVMSPRVASVPPSKARPPTEPPRLPADETTIVPPLIAVPPVWPLAPDSVSVPLPVLTSRSGPGPGGGVFDSEPLKRVEAPVPPTVRLPPPLTVPPPASEPIVWLPIKVSDAPAATVKALVGARRFAPFTKTLPASMLVAPV